MSKVEKTDLQPITDLEINIASCEVLICRGDQYGYTINNITGPEIEHAFENGKLTITQPFRFSLSLFKIDSRPSTVTVFLPEDADLSRVHIKTGSGQVDANGVRAADFDIYVASGDLNFSNIQAQHFKAKISSGNVSLDNIRADRLITEVSSGHIEQNHIEAGDVSVECTSGRIDVDTLKTDHIWLSLKSGTMTGRNMNTGGLRAEVTSGTLKLEGDFMGVSHVKTTSGRVEMKLAGALGDYRRSCHVTSGSVRVNGSLKNIEDSNPTAPNELNVQVTSGTVKLDFAK